MATTLGGTTLAEPAYENDGYEIEAVDVGAVQNLASGAVGYDYVATRRRFTLRWRNTSESDRNNAWTRYQVKTSQAFSPPDSASSITVIVVPNSWRCDYINAGDGTRYYTYEMQLEEVS